MAGDAWRAPAPWTADARAVQARVRRLRARGAAIAFVPTMGYLHAGHLSLIARAKKGGARVLASVFVNPLQFGPREDFRAYPRDRARDARLLAHAGVELVYAPRASAFTPEGHDTRVVVGGVAEPLEGEIRPGHFAGVATVVSKLLHVVEPDELWLGQKDAQQVAVLARMLHDLDFSVRLRVGATVREADGLALSSRNIRLTAAERAQAPALWRALRAGRAALLGGGRARASAAAAERAMREALRAATLARVDYAQLVDPATFRAPARGASHGLLVVAARFPSARLIDNLKVRWSGGLA
jgi:pantoate--beta-alanine ligase